MNKTVIIVIGIAIIAGIVGIYAVTTQGGPIGGEVGIGDQVGITVSEKEESTEESIQQEEFGLKDEAEVIVDEPTEEEPERIEITVEEKLGIEGNP